MVEFVEMEMDLRKVDEIGRTIFETCKIEVTQASKEWRNSSKMEWRATVDRMMLNAMEWMKSGRKMKGLKWSDDEETEL